MGTFGWGLAVIMVIVISWVFYRYFAPKGWREWAGAGLVQAFIIALYAEMYGFPLTVYLAIRFFGLDREYVSNSLWSTLLDFSETGMFAAMILGYGVAFTGIGLFIKGWKEVYRARQENVLVTTGLYRFARHPQYTGLFIALFGEGIIHWPTIFSISLLPLIVIAYYFLARKEEREMLRKFGDDYRVYQNQVPMFIPQWGRWKAMRKSSQES
ncbi:isoprenylcysteine carboxyl methyltransferase [Sphingomonadales bacterium EhC05]|jgi:protein-S-isoprenylcysteine O-methyltransferase Ste14|nr:isoprenylcysteine carboxyl methyltransferase [Sphingomonadales bacterium EhC05]|tara:strand:- start:3099 stop:3734 length:636 start_codon:yes stop_codon:yes gene_type:complete